eukprot:14517898-Alexandrium_andersonii.AAC.1
MAARPCRARERSGGMTGSSVSHGPIRGFYLIKCVLLPYGVGRVGWPRLARLHRPRRALGGEECKRLSGGPTWKQL